MSTVSTLEHLCLVQLAIAVCNNLEIRKLHSSILSSFIDSNVWEPFVYEKLSRHATLVVSKKVMCFIKPICLEIAMWKTNHFEILGHDIHKPINFSWNYMGTIDHLETAKHLVRSQNFTIPQRFTIACYYCMATDAKKLWKIASESEKRTLTKLANYKEEVYYKSSTEVHSRLIPGNMILRFWIKWLKMGAEDESQCEFLYCSLLWDRYIPVLSHILQKLPSEKALSFLEGRIKWNYRINNNERIYLSSLNLEQKKEFFKTCPFEILIVYLQWPLQTEFIRMADHLWSYLTEKNFLDVLFIIVNEKINKKWKDFNYFQLIAEFWHRSPDKFKEYVAKSKFFPCFKIYL